MLSGYVIWLCYLVMLSGYIVSLCYHYLPQAQAITPSHYSDVIDERNIEHLCGYPLCGTGLGPATIQRYHISYEKKQVYDLTERKVRTIMPCP